MASFGMFVALVATLAAAIARRLHDVGRSALWGLIPLPFICYSGAVFFIFASQASATTRRDFS